MGDVQPALRCGGDCGGDAEGGEKRISAMTSKQAKLYPHMVLMIDVLCACIETRVYPVHGSPCHRMARRLVADSGMAPKRMRRRLPAVKGAAAAMPWEGGL
jgi:hypothetical protein